ncbi:MAG: tetratricopeptide repeat protein, partial [Candidatus Hydrogenedentes bacterium]|nr:tetratricopeptide repeat protein [Candidatus Hydrogenedentota bacterium]
LVGMAAFGMGRCSLQLGQFEQASRLFDKAAELIPELKPQIAAMMPRNT